ncbi:phosphatase YxeH [Acrasis kona]|uniref:Phosphatase YxeH n=1 Tax=Acrasis kona TaxID=1008807 RepID=A0AAW2ZFB4_9EUKA
MAPLPNETIPTPASTPADGRNEFPFDLVATDLDGTLLNSEKKMTDATKDTLRQLHFDHGVKIVMASGRPVENMVCLYRELGIHDAHVIGHNGAKCLKITSEDDHEEFFHSAIAPDLCVELFKFCQKRNLCVTMYRGGVCVALKSDEEKFADLHKVFSEVTTNEIWEYVDNCEDVKKMNLTSGVIVCDNEQDADAVMGELKQYMTPEQAHIVKTECGNFRHHKFFVEVLHPLANKGKALKILCDKLDVDPSKVISFGDGENDLEMFEFSGKSISMANACPKAKEVSDQVSEHSNIEEAVHKELSNILSSENM